MTNGGFFEQGKRANKTGLTIVIAGHAAVLAALVLAPPDAVQRIVYLPTIVDSIKDTPPPAKDPPPPMVQRENTPPTRVDAIVKTGDPVPTIELTPMPPRPLPPVLPQIPATPESATLPATIDPSAMARFQPDYPSELVRAELEGTATVRVLIGTDGRVKAVELVSATHPGFFDATKRQALRYWRFRPATRDGIATESWRTMTVRFTLED
ncbi:MULTISPECIES: energy transducer TonB [unclassified Sphingomonas]|uniref:energy transducer TonB n=1 Tax=unclassified Sphingomonas TaxID=196159 RepID=UPI00070162FF|nr:MULTISPECIES: energy transducer TonB [unclassified Sphingomonas]KQX20865.1 energy transducer TonB [Sphingomonas sp. Root1294]KQY68711.1 energy transducer TonB [Sphingomonas sp. Root50]KRB88115.1 energy transducer TonB [Sphingomonas sp. Root720]